MRGLIAHIARWVAWHTDGAVIGDSARADAQITVFSTAPPR